MNADVPKQEESGSSRAEENLQAILASPSYVLAELDTDLLQRDELRPIRVQLELLKPGLILHPHAQGVLIITRVAHGEV